MRVVDEKKYFEHNEGYYATDAIGKEAHWVNTSGLCSVGHTVTQHFALKTNKKSSVLIGKVQAPPHFTLFHNILSLMNALQISADRCLYARVRTVGYMSSVL